MRSAGDLVDTLGGAKGALIAIGLITLSPLFVAIGQVTAAVARLILPWAPRRSWRSARRATRWLPSAPAHLPCRCSRCCRSVRLGPAARPQRRYCQQRGNPCGGDGAREGKLDEWQRQNPTLGERFWRWPNTPLAGLPAPGAGGGGIPFGEQLVPLAGVILRWAKSSGQRFASS
jgi:hypothetical protein